ncbi:MAG: hypothetical protein LBE01_03485 [Deltaproteobacteria bacterium]|jgi:dissimilatory sulfite reductase (desulfoviridin) alpha/beta subunit|nr:hypothetical protein [Deltaproteobacteria bacterium]
MSDADEAPKSTQDLLELDLSPEETALAQVPNELTNLSSDATHPLTEAPSPAGALMESAPILEPMLTARPAPAADRLAQAPAFFLRLSLVDEPGRVRVKPEAPRAFSLTAGDNWPVFLLRSSWLGPPPAEDLKALAAAARKLGGDRVCLGPHNELDVFFNDRKSLEQAAKLAPAPAPDPGDWPFRLMACPGLFFCKEATKDTLSTAEALAALAKARPWPPLGDRAPLVISIAGCQAGQGQDCGLYEYADLTFQGRRRVYPVIDQELAALSPKVARLVANCPNGAISRSSKPETALELNQKLCGRCGWCAHEDPAFGWPSPQGGHFRLVLSGRRLGHVPVYLAPKVAWDPVPEDLALAGEKIFALIDLWLDEARVLEPFLEFLERRGLLGNFDQPPKPLKSPATG